MSTIRATFVQHGSSPVPNITLNASGQVIVASGIVSSGTFAAPSGSVSAPGLYFVGDSNTGIYSPAADTIAFTEGGVEALRIDSTGQVGIGTSAPGAKLTIQQAANTILEGLLLVASSGSVNGGWYHNGSALVGREGGFDTINLAAGKVGIGTTSPGKNLDIEASDPRLRLSSNASNNATVELLSNAKTSFIYSQNSGNLNLQANNELILLASAGTERARIDSSGRFLVGTSSGSSLLTVNGTANISGATVLGSTLNLTSGGITNGYTGTVTAGNYEARGSAPSITLRSTSGGLGNPYLYFRADGAAGKSIIGVTWDTTAPTLIFEAAGNEIASLTPQGAFSCAGTGRVNDGISASTKRIGFSSSIGGGSGGLVVQTDNPLAFLNRLSTDGTLIEFYQAGTSEGSISVSGTTVSYNGGHISRWSQILGIDPHDKAERPEILRGTVMSNLDEMCEWIEAPKEALLWQEGDDLPEGVSVGDIKEPACSGGPQCNEQLNKTKISDVEGDKNVAGVFQSWDDDDDTWVNDYYLAMTGDFVIRIAASVTVERGDLLMSAGDGTAKPQNDDIIRSKTIAKVTSTTVSCTYEDSSYCVPCVLMAC